MLLPQISRLVARVISRCPMTWLPRECPWRQQPDLVVSAESPKIFTELFLAFGVNVRQRIYKFALEFSGLDRKQEIQVAIDQGFLRTRSVSAWNNYITQYDQSLILMVVEKGGSPIGISQERGSVFAFRSRREAG